MPSPFIWRLCCNSSFSSPPSPRRREAQGSTRGGPLTSIVSGGDCCTEHNTCTELIPSPRGQGTTSLFGCGRHLFETPTVQCVIGLQRWFQTQALGVVLQRTSIEISIFANHPAFAGLSCILHFYCLVLTFPLCPAFFESDLIHILVIPGD